MKLMPVAVYLRKLWFKNGVKLNIQKLLILTGKKVFKYFYATMKLL